MSSLSDAKVGDFVMVQGSGFGGSSHAKRTIIKTTKHQVVLDDQSRWLRYGRRVGSDTWSREYARPWDEALHQDIEREESEKRLKNIVCRFFSSSECRALTLDQWTRIKAICDEEGVVS